MSLLGQLTTMALPATPQPVDYSFPPLPVAADATTALLRPTGRSIARLTVGPDKTYSTISAAIAAGTAAQSARGASEAVPFAARGGHPDYRVDIVIDAGTYPESISTTRDIALYADGEVVVTGVMNALGCIVSQGGEYVEGITFRRDAISGVAAGNLPKYPQHHASSTRTSIFAGCTFHTEVEGQSNWTSIGMDGSSGGRSLWYGCTLSSANPAAASMNLHGAAVNTVPGVYVFVNTNSPDVPINYNSLHASLADELWVIGGTFKTISTGGAGTILHYQPGVSLGTVSPSGPSDTNTAWPVPTGGIGSLERALYYPFA